MDIGETIKFRVTGESFEESSPIGPPVADEPNNTQTGNSEPKVPYKILVREHSNLFIKTILIGKFS